MIEIIDGHKGKAHVTASQIGLCNMGEYGKNSYILNVGNCLKGSVISGNRFRILDGCFSIQGRRGCIPAGSYEEVTVDNGSQGQTRKDAVCVEYTKSPEGAESFTIKVVKGTPSSDYPKLPDVVIADINGSGVKHQEPFYVITVTDAGIGDVARIINILDPVSEIIEDDDITPAIGEIGVGFLKKFGQKKYPWGHVKAIRYNSTQTLSEKLVAIENDYNGKISDVAQEAIEAFKQYLVPTKVNMVTDPNSFVVVGNSSFSTSNIASLHLYIKSGANVLANEDELLLGKIGLPVKEETIIQIFDDVAKQFMIGKIHQGGAITFHSRNFTGERYLIIDTTICF